MNGKGVYIHLEPAVEPWRQFMALMWAISLREMKGRYRRSALGILWAVLPPVFYAGLFTALQGILHIGTDDVPYVLFAYAGLVPWAFFVNAVNRCGGSVGANAGIVKKVAVPRTVFPVTAVVTALADFAVSSALLAGLLAWFGIHPAVAWLWLAPLLLITSLFSLGCGLIVGALGTFLQDVLFGLPLLLQLWMLATPIMYPLRQVPAGWMPLYILNPMVGIIEGFRQVLIRQQAPDFELLGVSLVATACVWGIGWPLFKYLSQHFADAV
ncbi:MAG TPA: ABC transporter permease [Nitrospira sp.]|nr:ABC transporter permease [Nitrospira sp.]